jgi:hypothetical protein
MNMGCHKKNKFYSTMIVKNFVQRIVLCLMLFERLCLLPAKSYKQVDHYYKYKNNVSLVLILLFSAACVFP